jgi:alkylation response protein AidB-like acyl-CoA dehydrogenase
LTPDFGSIEIKRQLNKGYSDKQDENAGSIVNSLYDRKNILDIVIMTRHYERRSKPSARETVMSEETRHDLNPEFLTASLLLERMTAAEKERARRVEQVLPTLRERAVAVDRDAEFHLPHIQTLSQAGLLGLIIPTEYGGLGGALRDLAAATFAMGAACPSTALAYFFHCSSASRGLLGLEAIAAGLFNDDEAPVVRAFAEKVLWMMGRDGKWLANFASESTKTSQSRVAISTEAVKVDGGWALNGVKSFGCATGVADHYLVTAKLAGADTAEGLSLFIVSREQGGVSERARWDAIGMRGTATHGIVLKDVFVKSDDALAIPGAFVRMMQMSRGTFVGNQLAATAIYLGAAQAVYDHTIRYLQETKFADTGAPLGSSPMHQWLIGEMTTDLETAYQWLRRQLELETSEPPLLPKDRVVRQWRMAKGAICETAFRVAVNAFKACGTSNTGMSGVVARGLRDLAMGLVQAFPAERGKLDAAEMVINERPPQDFAVGQTEVKR